MRWIRLLPRNISDEGPVDPDPATNRRPLPRLGHVQLGDSLLRATSNDVQDWNHFGHAWAVEARGGTKRRYRWRENSRPTRRFDQAITAPSMKAALEVALDLGPYAFLRSSTDSAPIFRHPP